MLMCYRRENRKYLAGSKLRMIGAKVLSSIDVCTQTLLYMQNLVGKRKGIVHFAKLLDSRAVYILPRNN